MAPPLLAGEVGRGWLSVRFTVNALKSYSSVSQGRLDLEQISCPKVKCPYRTKAKTTSTLFLDRP